jgi:adenine/guanine phosphoribosyltransferase-like PRPP-binding protein
MNPHEFWQDILADDAEPATDFFPARFDDGRVLRLPLRPLPDGKHALASLIINQASFAVVAALAADLADKLRPFAPDIIVGLPTLGLTLAAAVAEQLGHRRYVPLGTSRKFWYREDLSVPLASITTPGQPKRLYIDPRMLPLLTNQRVALVDDVISTGASMSAAITLLAQTGITPIALGTAMLQSDAWATPLAAWTTRTATVLRSPVLPLAAG